MLLLLLAHVDRIRIYNICAEYICVVGAHIHRISEPLSQPKPTKLNETWCTEWITVTYEYCDVYDIISIELSDERRTASN